MKLMYIDSKELDEATRERLHSTLKKSEAELTEFDIEFLRARRPYIKQKHQDLFPSVFGKKGDRDAKKRAEEAQQPKEEVEDPKPEDPFTEEKAQEGEDTEEEELLG